MNLISRRLSLSLAMLAGILSGCGTAQKAFTPSTAPHAAQVTFVSRSPHFNLGVLHLPGAAAGCACSSSEPEMIGIFNNKAVLMAGHASYADKGQAVDRFTVNVDANGGEFRFLIGLPEHDVQSVSPVAQVRLRYCQAHHSFVPQPGARYVVTYDPQVARCDARLAQLQGDVAVPIQMKQHPMCAPRADDSDRLSDLIRQRCAAERGRPAQ